MRKMIKYEGILDKVAVNIANINLKVLKIE